MSRYIDTPDQILKDEIFEAATDAYNHELFLYKDRIQHDITQLYIISERRCVFLKSHLESIKDDGETIEYKNINDELFELHLYMTKLDQVYYDQFLC